MWLDLSQLSDADRCRLGRRFRANELTALPKRCEQKLREAEKERLALSIERWATGLTFVFLCGLAWLLWG